MKKEESNAAVPHVYTAISAVMAEIGKQGISKDRKNDQQGYNFRGIDDVYNALAPILSEAQLCILPYVKGRTVTERQTQRGGVLFYVNVDVDFHLVSAKDGSTHVISVCGEAMDSGDKATNKAMSAAYKYACMQAFCIPTEGDNDADKTTHQVVAAPPAVVTINEVNAINKLAKSAGVDVQKIADAYGIASIDKLPLVHTADVIARLQAKIAEAKQQPAETKE